MKKFQVLVLSLLAVIQVHAQWYQGAKVPPKAEKLYFSAIEALRDGQWNEGKMLLNKAVDIYPKYVDAWLSMGGMYGQLKRYDSAVYFYEKAYLLDSLYTNDLLLPWSINLAGLGRFGEAKALVEKFLTAD